MTSNSYIPKREYVIVSVLTRQHGLLEKKEIKRYHFTVN